MYDRNKCLQCIHWDRIMNELCEGCYPRPNNPRFQPKNSRFKAKHKSVKDVVITFMTKVMLFLSRRS